MSIHNKLQRFCLKFLTTPVDQEEDSLNLFDSSLAENSKVVTLILNICKVATAEENAVSDLGSCFDFISLAPATSMLNLSKYLNTKQENNFATMRDLLYEDKGFELQPLNKLQKIIFAILNYIVRNNSPSLPKEKFELLQQALLGDEDIQTDLVINDNDILLETTDTEFNSLIEQYQSVIAEYREPFKAIADLIQEINDNAQDEDYNLERSLFDIVYEKLITAQANRCPKIEMLITLIQETQFEFAEKSVARLSKAMRISSADEVKLFLQDALDWAKQAEKILHPRTKNLVTLIEELSTAYKKGQAETYCKRAMESFEKASRRSKYNSISFAEAAKYAVLAKKEGCKEAEPMRNNMENTRLDKEMRVLAKDINKWLEHYEQDLPVGIIEGLNKLKYESKHLSGVTVAQKTLDSIDVSFKIIDARNLILSKKYEEAQELIGNIKQKGTMPVEIASIETVLNWHLQEHTFKQEQKKKKPARVLNQNETETSPSKIHRQKHQPKIEKVPSTDNGILLNGGKKRKERSEQPNLASSRIEKRVSFYDDYASKSLTNESIDTTGESQQSVPSSKSLAEELEESRPSKRVSFEAIANDPNENTEPQSKRVSFQLDQPNLVKRDSFEAYPSTTSETYGHSSGNILKSLAEKLNQSDDFFPDNHNQSVETSEIVPLLILNQTHSINADQSPKMHTNADQPPRKITHSNFWKYFGIAMCVLGVTMMIGGAVLLTLLTGGVDLIVGGALLGLGALTTGGGLSLTCYESCRSASVEHKQEIETKVVSYQTKYEEPANDQSFSHPANLFGKQSIVNKENTLPLTCRQEAANFEHENIINDAITQTMFVK